MSNKSKKSKKSNEDLTVTIDNNLPFDKFIDRYAKREDVYFKSVSTSVCAITETEKKAHSRPAYVIENLTMKVKNLSIGLKDRSLPDTFIFRNCTFITTSDTDASFITLLAEKKAEFEDCSFNADDRTCFTVEPFGDLNITRSSSHTILAQGLANSDIRIDSCDIHTFFAMSAQNIHFVSKLPYTTAIDQTTSVTVSYVYEFPKHPTGSRPIFTVKNGTNGAIAFIRINDSNLASDRIVSIQDSVYTVYASYSHISTLVINESLIRQLRTINSTVDMLKTVDSSLIEYAPSEQDVLRHSALTKSHGFPDRPMILYKKARFRLLSCNPFSKPNITRPEEIIVKLSVPSSALKHYDTMSKKIRVSEAVVVGFYNLRHEDLTIPKLNRILKRYVVSSYRDSSFRYWLNKTVTPVHPFNTTDDVCASGIHGFIDFDDAASYSW